ncbi:hypothetical protein P171DRAFT_198563 [Karstenula rhodostoma CBS 690.94]|uniref:Uncharacterized protein n=1 Tax=Karstenula rhodostoma CBS 690.94 TaxID=1392251 RepID=A0A9P4UHX3_9PLEO|nr:hypothetical protein P171DRAFT_198563 [Karstenula rhodostoma CBS 690.94]
MLNGREVLDKQFAIGWNKLPAELKLEILSYDPKLNGDFKRRNKKHNPGNQGGWKTLLRYHKMTPELGALATEIFYAKHHFRIEGADDQMKQKWNIVSVQKLFFPKPEVNQFIKLLYFRVPLDSLAWSRLQRLANGDFGFERLNHLTVEVVHTVYYRLKYGTFLHRGSLAPAHLEVSKYEPVVFRHAGAVIYTCNLLDHPWDRPENSKKGTFVREMERLLQNTITFTRARNHSR